MSIVAKHAYRFGYLKSEEWTTVRLEALANAQGKCRICGFQDHSNDAHHIYYPPKWKDTKSYDLVVLCRSCHELVHAILEFEKKKGDPRDEAFRQFEVMLSAVNKWRQAIGQRDVRLLGHEIGKCCGCRKNEMEVEVFTFGANQHMPERKICLCFDCAIQFRKLGPENWSEMRIFLKWRSGRLTQNDVDTWIQKYDSRKQQEHTVLTQSE